MAKIALGVAAFIVAAHGLIHLMGLVAYWPLAELKDLPYKTALFGDRWEVGRTGMRLFSVLWLLAAVGFVAAVGGWLADRPWAAGLMAGAAVLSLAICLADWSAAWRGALISLVILIASVVALGLQMKPARFPAYAEQTPPLEQVPVPEGLPEPVARFYQVISGDTVPVIHSAVLTGTAPLRINGITLNSRFRFTHDAGQNYRHYIESTIFGQPALKVNEWYLDGKGRMELPFGTTENEPAVDRAANLGLWGESIWLPSIWLTDPRVRWEAVDAQTARLVVPFGTDEDFFTVTFDPQTGLIAQMEAMRPKGTDPDKLTRWILKPEGWQQFNGLLIPSPASVTWEDEGTPWAVFTLDDVRFNVDVAEYVRGRGL